MEMSEYIADLKLQLTGNLLELEIDDKTLEQVFNMALRELQRYINETKLVTVHYSSCIDLSELNCSTVTRIFRAASFNSDTLQEQTGVSSVDPMWAQRWAIYSNGYGMYNMTDWLLNYMSYNTIQQVSSTFRTDLAFTYDKQSEKLYIDMSGDNGDLTIEYIPVFKDVSEIKSDYWQDVLKRLAVALTKQILGRIRSKYKSSNGLWEIDGSTILEEGNTELQTLRDELRTNSQITYTMD